ncbi:uncharacterized protein LOC122085635 [Macadamia integrifolia]|uniref:uncharacterized protein LOC122085635 n=1 Tax=Macadamia integrifolia TaxID=60698 RepID=UPI001C501094|nr:uncharacterized protein LOC122085635 [Macadamia integrifolia]
MTLSLNSVAGFQSTLQAKSHNFSRTCPGASGLKIDYITASTGRRFWFGSRINDNRSCLVISAADGNKVATDSTNKDSRISERALPRDQSSSAEPLSISSSPVTIQHDTSAQDGLGRQIPKDSSNGLQVPSDVKQIKSGASSMQSTVKRSSLTAREKLRAARVLSRYAESKPSKPELGSKVLNAMREGDKGKKRPGLPEAPENLFDDSKRGLPKAGLTFDLPGGVDLFIIVSSAVFIATVMFATAFIVWKAGAIHFNEY